MKIKLLANLILLAVTGITGATLNAQNNAAINIDGLDQPVATNWTPTKFIEL